MKRMFALMLAGAIILTTPSIALAGSDQISSPYAKGYLDGLKEGKEEGYKQGNTEGYNQGRNDGYNAGQTAGYNQGNANGYNQGKTDGYNQGQAAGYNQGSTDGYNTGRADGYKDGRADGKELGQVQGKVEVYENTVIPMMNQRITDLQNQVNKLYDKVITQAKASSKNNSKIEITVKTSNNNSKPKVVVKKVVNSTVASSPTEAPFVHTVLNAPGLCNTTPVGQGGKLVICGKTTRATFTMRETTSGKVTSAQLLAKDIGGSVKNVVETYAPGVRFSKAQVDFKVYGCRNGDVYKVYQMGPNGTWQEVQVDEVREGHVICTVNKAGTFAFIKMN